jgi:hypothetical protein
MNDLLLLWQVFSPMPEEQADNSGNINQFFSLPHRGNDKKKGEEI